MQDKNMQELTAQEKDNETAEADNIKYQVSLASEEAAHKLRNSVTGTKGIPLKRMGPGGENQMQKPM